MSHEVVVMRDGIVVERGPTEVIFAAPRRAHTKELMVAAFRIEAIEAVAVRADGQADDDGRRDCTSAAPP